MAPTGAQPWAMLPVQPPPSTASGAAGLPYTPIKASRAVSKAFTSPSVQNTA